MDWSRVSSPFTMTYGLRWRDVEEKVDSQRSPSKEVECKTCCRQESLSLLPSATHVTTLVLLSPYLSLVCDSTSQFSPVTSQFSPVTSQSVRSRHSKVRSRHIPHYNPVTTQDTPVTSYNSLTTPHSTVCRMNHSQNKVQYLR